MRNRKKTKVACRGKEEGDYNKVRMEKAKKKEEGATTTKRKTMLLIKAFSGGSNET